MRTTASDCVAMVTLPSPSSDSVVSTHLLPIKHRPRIDEGTLMRTIARLRAQLLTAALSRSALALLPRN
jgi:hypothetical protein